MFLYGFHLDKTHVKLAFFTYLHEFLVTGVENRYLNFLEFVRRKALCILICRYNMLDDLIVEKSFCYGFDFFFLKAS